VTVDGKQIAVAGKNVVCLLDASNGNHVIASSIALAFVSIFSAFLFALVFDFNYCINFSFRFGHKLCHMTENSALP
jgi:hypothetical protein